MEYKLAKYIVNVAAASYLVMGAIFFVLMILKSDNPLDNPLFVKSLNLLVIYAISILLIYFSKNRDLNIKAYMWFASLILHIGIMSYIIYKFGNIAAIVIMLPECVILVLIIMGITSIMRRLFNTEKENA